MSRCEHQQKLRHGGTQPTVYLQQNCFFTRMSTRPQQYHAVAQPGGLQDRLPLLSSLIDAIHFEIASHHDPSPWRTCFNQALCVVAGLHTTEREVLEDRAKEGAKQPIPRPRAPGEPAT